jgi:hypothetical protein
MSYDTVRLTIITRMHRYVIVRNAVQGVFLDIEHFIGL